jgi:hypothetical protein
VMPSSASSASRREAAISATEGGFVEAAHALMSCALCDRTLAARGGSASRRTRYNGVTRSTVCNLDLNLDLDLNH